MSHVYLMKKGRGFLPADDEACRIHLRMEFGEAVAFKPLRIRDLKAHKRYWQLMTMCADNCERIEIEPGIFMAVHSKDDVHTAVKFATGHYDTILDAEGKPAFRVQKSTSFDEMTADEWAQYWPRVLQVVQERILPGVSLPSVETELLKCMGMAA